jgi:hypothetical protein
MGMYRKFVPEVYSLGKITENETVNTRVIQFRFVSQLNAAQREQVLLYIFSTDFVQKISMK